MTACNDDDNDDECQATSLSSPELEVFEIERHNNDEAGMIQERRPFIRRLKLSTCWIVKLATFALIIPLAMALRGTLSDENRTAAASWSLEQSITTCPRQEMFLLSTTNSLLTSSSSSPNKETASDNEKEESSQKLVIDIQPQTRLQPMEGFGVCLTGASAQHLAGMTPAARQALLRELFGKDQGQLNISLLRLSIGASDLEEYPFSYNDLPPDEQDDMDLVHFSLGPHETHLIPIIQEILQINPNIRFLASPWSAPPWMKSDREFRGGSLLPEYYNVYAQYFVRYIQAMQEHGIAIDMITVQNEPLYGGNTPSMVLTAAQEIEFVRDALAPTLSAAGLTTTKIIVYDHNPDRMDYPLQILDDPTVSPFVHGSAFHLYVGEIESLSRIHEAHPDKAIYFTEQWVSSDGAFEPDLFWHAEHVFLGAPRNWARAVLEWNLSSNADLTPYTTPGGCSLCLGAVTIDGDQVTRNVVYYLLSHVSPFVPLNSVRVTSSDVSKAGVVNVCFLTPQGRLVVVLANLFEDAVQVKLKIQGTRVPLELLGRSLSTLVFASTESSSSNSKPP